MHLKPKFHPLVDSSEREGTKRVSETALVAKRTAFTIADGKLNETYTDERADSTRVYSLNGVLDSGPFKKFSDGRGMSR